MQKIYLAFIFCFITIIANAQENNEKLEEYAVPAFTGLDAGSLSNVYITIGSPQSLKIAQDKDEDRSTIVKVKDSILEIRHTTDGDNNKLSNEKIYITCPNLKYIKLSGVSRAQFKTPVTLIDNDNRITLKTQFLEINESGASKLELDVEVDSLKTDISGAAKLTVRGKAIQHKSSMSGAAKINAKELIVNNMDVKGSGVAKADVNVKNKISGQLSGLSTVNYDKAPDTVLTNNNTFSRNNTSDENKIEDLKFNKDSIKIIILGDEKEKNTIFTFGNTEIATNKHGKVFIEKTYETPKSHRFRGHWAGFELAYNGYVDKNFSSALPTQYEFLKLNTAKSVGVNLNLFELNANIINNRFGVVSGIGFQWNNYRFDRDVVLLPDSGRIAGYHNTNIHSYLKSKLAETWVRVPLFLEYQTAKRKWKQFHIAAGGVFGYKIDSHSKQVHYEGGERNYDKLYNDFYLNPIKLDGEVRIGWGPINLFASYSFTQMFEKNKGPEIYPFMIGITLASW
jgi:hypothetical protein